MVNGFFCFVYLSIEIAPFLPHLIQLVFCRTWIIRLWQFICHDDYTPSYDMFVIFDGSWAYRHKNKKISVHLIRTKIFAPWYHPTFVQARICAARTLLPDNDGKPSTPTIEQCIQFQCTDSEATFHLSPRSLAPNGSSLRRQRDVLLFFNIFFCLRLVYYSILWSCCQERLYVLSLCLLCIIISFSFYM